MFYILQWIFTSSEGHLWPVFENSDPSPRYSFFIWNSFCILYCIFNAIPSQFVVPLVAWISLLKPHSLHFWRNFKTVNRERWRKTIRAVGGLLAALEVCIAEWYGRILKTSPYCRVLFNLVLTAAEGREQREGGRIKERYYKLKFGILRLLLLLFYCEPLSDIFVASVLSLKRPRCLSGFRK